MYDVSSPVAVTAHDAGAANLILGWLGRREGLTVRCAVGGPARALFLDAWPDVPHMSVSESLAGAAVLLSGTSGDSDLEHHARILARRQQVRSIGVLDHWVHYRERFIRRGVVVMPDELWVFDQYALASAQKIFPNVSILQKPNRYLERLVSEIRGISVPGSACIRILYVLEPAKSSWSRGDIPGEFQALDYFISLVESLASGHPVEIRLRPHPSDSPAKYEGWLKSTPARGVSLDSVRPLSQAIAWADWVVGCETFAMVVALEAGKRVFSSLPPWAPQCRLPHDGIVQLRNVAAGPSP